MIFKNLFKTTDLSQKPLSWQNKDVTIILDNGHGKETAGKRSPKWPDGSQLFEWEFNRDIVKRIAEQLKQCGIKYEILVPEDKDISLEERVKRANRIWKKTNKKCFIVSVHANAGCGTGWEVWTSVGKTKSDDIAQVFWNEMKSEFPTQKMRLDMTDGDIDKEKNFYILYKSSCPAILTENFFMDNEKDCKEILMKSLMRQKIANAHVNAIKKTLMNLY
jgi:N-acetylmuramoyl-L-alanine amidase